MEEKIKIIGLYVFDRLKEAGLTQKILTKYSYLIKTRLGFHEVSEDISSRNAIMILVLTGDQKDWEKLELELLEVAGVEAQEMTFNNA